MRALTDPLNYIIIRIVSIGHPVPPPLVPPFLLESKFILLSHYTRQGRGHREALRPLKSATLGLCHHPWPCTLLSYTRADHWPPSEPGLTGICTCHIHDDGFEPEACI